MIASRLIGKTPFTPTAEVAIVSNRTFNNRAASQNGPAVHFAAVTPNDAADLPGGLTRSLYVGGAGVIVVADQFGNTVRLASGAGQYHPLRVSRVLASGTTATEVVALY